MTVDIEHFVRIRPYLYHVSARQNLAALAAERMLHPAGELMRRAARSDLVRWRRTDPVTLVADGRVYVLKDQRPLIANNADFEGCSVEEFVEYLNEHVFFWPGTAERPVSSGVRLQQRYEIEAPLVLRMRAEALLAENPETEPLFCQFNSGAPRRQGGRRVRRGLRLFTAARDFSRRESEVVEVAFRGSLRLPSDAEVRDASGWSALPLL